MRLDDDELLRRVQWAIVEPKVAFAAYCGLAMVLVLLGVVLAAACGLLEVV